jgi:Domain of Unknown Function (DUF928)
MKRAFYFCLLAFLVAGAGGAQQSSTPTKPAGSKPGTNPKKKLLDADLQGFELSDDKNVHTTVGGTRGVENALSLATPLAPKVAKLYGPSALFQWSTKSQGDGYIFTIVDEDEARVVREQLKDQNYKLADGMSKLKPGETYQWKVQVLPQTVPGVGSDFMVVSDQERQQIEKDLAAIPTGDAYESGFARARVFVAHHLWFDSIGAYTELIEKFPDRAQLYEDRGAIYSTIDATRKLGEADRAKAVALQSGSAH